MTIDLTAAGRLAPAEVLERLESTDSAGAKTAMATLGAILPFTPLGHILGFSTLPATFFLILVAMVITYLTLVEFAKSWFYAREQSALARSPTTHRERLHRRRRRRAARFLRHETARPR
jgi:Mg2+-importing ATPase